MSNTSFQCVEWLIKKPEPMPPGLKSGWSRIKYLINHLQSELERVTRLAQCMTWWVEKLMDLLTHDQGKMLAWLAKTGELLERIYERMEFLYYRLAVYTMACFWSYSEFPGRIRPPCTTMPWTIWPALVVLWGVCWMFYPSPGDAPGTTELDNRSHLEYESQPGDLSGMFLN